VKPAAAAAVAGREIPRNGGLPAGAKLAIRELVEFIVRSGDIDSRYTPRDRMHEGARIHRALQKKNMEKYAGYQSEVWLSAEFVCQNAAYVLDGHAGGAASA